MDIHELFEQHYADVHDRSAYEIAQHRMVDGSYRVAKMATAFRMFKAGFEANQGEKVQVLGYVSLNNAQKLIDGKMTTVRKEPTDTHPVALYTKQCDPLKLEMKHEKQ